VAKQEKHKQASGGDPPSVLTGARGLARPPVLRRVSAVTGGSAPRLKGDRTERALARLLQGHGFAAQRVPLSGAARGRFGGDLSVPLLGFDRRVEVKARANGFATLYGWLDAADLLVIKADRREPLVVVPLRLAVEIAMAAERRRP
jgi:hypothetical protein